MEALSAQSRTVHTFLELGLYLKYTLVEEPPISSVPNDDAVSFVIAEGIRLHGCEHHAEQCGGKDTRLA